jgi:hypothetical protein
MEFVWEFRYTSIDYLYDGLVAIQLDTDVMAMVKEHETEKEVSLFVTKQRITTLAPSKFKKAPAKSAPKKSKGSMMNPNLLSCDANSWNPI